MRFVSIRMSIRVLAAILFGTVVAGCDLPRDPEGTLENVQGKELRVGVVQAGESADHDRRIVEHLARSLQAKPVYREGDAHVLFKSLEQGRLHLIVGGIPKSTPFKDAGFSKAAGPLLGSSEDEERVLAVRAGENAFLLRVNRAIEAVRAGGEQS